MTKNEIKLLKITKLLQEVYGNELNDKKNDFEKVFETITDDLRHYLVWSSKDDPSGFKHLYETMNKELKQE